MFTNPFICSVICGETFFSSDHLQTISTPNWPKAYSVDQDCDWIIHGVGGKAFQVVLGQGETEPDMDYLEVNYYCDSCKIIIYFLLYVVEQAK